MRGDDRQQQAKFSFLSPEARVHRVLAQARQRNLLSDEHFTVDATLLEAWASLKSFRPKDEPPATPPDDPGNPTVDFHGERRRNDTHQSTTDPDARLYRKGPGREAKLCYMGHVVMENRHGLVVRAHATLATGTAEVETAEDLVEQLAGDPDESDGTHAESRRRTVGADKGFDTEEFVGAMRDLNVTPHVAQKMMGSAIDGRTTRHPGYATSQTFRKRVEILHPQYPYIPRHGRSRPSPMVHLLFLHERFSRTWIRRLSYEPPPAAVGALGAFA